MYSVVCVVRVGVYGCCVCVVCVWVCVEVGSEVMGPRGDGTRGDGTRGDGTRGDGTRGDGTRSDGARDDGTRSGMSYKEAEIRKVSAYLLKRFMHCGFRVCVLCRQPDTLCS